MNKISNIDHKKPCIGNAWIDQGGIYAGTRLIDGKEHHIIIADGIEHDIQNVKFDDVEKAVPTEINGHSDWRAPDQEDLMLAYVNVRQHFVHKGSDSLYWSRSVHHNWPWAVGFEDGTTHDLTRDFEFRVRPFRSFPANTI